MKRVGDRLSDKSHVSVSRPNKVRMETTGGDTRRVFVYNGTEISLFDSKRNAYAVIKAPDTLDDALDLVIERYGVTLPLAHLLRARVRLKSRG